MTMLMPRKVAPTTNANSSKMAAKPRKAKEMEDRTTSTPSEGGSLLGPEMEEIAKVSQGFRLYLISLF